MQRKPNEKFVRKYCRQFSEKITSAFFADNETINGKEILDFSPSPQVNLFILKILFANWREQMKRLESPYFNYRDPDVKRAMVDFMNILSQKIQIDEDDFYELVDEAVYDTLKLGFTPEKFLYDELIQKDITLVDEKVARPLLKYIRLHKSHFETFLEENDGEDLDTFLDISREYFADIDVEATMVAELARLSEIHPVTFDDLLDKEHVEKPRDLPPDDNPEEEDEPEEMDKAEISDDDPEIHFFDNSSSEEGVRFHTEETSTESVQSDDDAEPDQPINQKFAESRTTVNDLYAFEEKITVADQLEKKEVTNIMEAISINHRYMFTKELFDGDREEFTAAISKIELSGSFDNAVEMLVQDYAKERNWDMNSEEVKELLKVVFRKFR